MLFMLLFSISSSEKMHPPLLQISDFVGLLHNTSIISAFLLWVGDVINIDATVEI